MGCAVSKTNVNVEVLQTSTTSNEFSTNTSIPNSSDFENSNLTSHDELSKRFSKEEEISPEQVSELSVSRKGSDVKEENVKTFQETTDDVVLINSICSTETLKTNETPKRTSKWTMMNSIHHGRVSDMMNEVTPVEMSENHPTNTRNIGKTMNQQGATRSESVMSQHSMNTSKLTTYTKDKDKCKMDMMETTIDLKSVVSQLNSKPPTSDDKLNFWREQSVTQLWYNVSKCQTTSETSPQSKGDSQYYSQEDNDRWSESSLINEKELESSSNFVEWSDSSSESVILDDGSTSLNSLSTEDTLPVAYKHWAIRQMARPKAAIGRRSPTGVSRGYNVFH